MNGLNKHLVVAFVSIAILFVGMAHTATFPQFDKMIIEAQAEFVAVMLGEVENALRSNGNSDAATRIEHLFTTVLPGDRIPLGLVEFERNEARARVLDAERAEKDPQARRLDVEDALFVTLKKNNIVLSKDAGNAVLAALANFHPQTYAEFEAKSLAEQRRFIALLAKFDWPDLCFRQTAQARLKGNKERKFDLIPGVVEAKFPSQSSDQPGFAEIAAKVKAESAKTPKAAGPFYELEMYILRTADAQIIKGMDEMDATTVLLPDGRHVYRDKNGDLWAVRGHDGDDTKLSGAEKDMAERLAACREKRGI